MFRSRRVLAQRMGLPPLLRMIAPSVLALALFGCEHKQPAAPAAPPPGMPPLAGNAAAPPSADKPEHAPAAEPQLPPGHPALPPGHPAMGQMGGNIDPNGATPGNIQFDPKTVIAGVLRLDDKVKAKVKEGDTIFMAVRAADPSGAPGPILAVKRFTAGKWPMMFQLDSRDAMMAGTSLQGKVVVGVRVDKDGDALTKNPGDVTGSSTLKVPDDKVVVTLDTVL